ncbi:hypothetical protein Agabi119p4_10813 [Agaricus bisporus var. burnettii]|uniref:F-box domain-containing protein n=1 Tax=Agaricus bisporus var. burnettii TaxID=192524 RepID=A0A8H7EVP6_AGABI|nr:hypothetical protein Agabi119p4_10813 [Agaricus bisporus var. burnettii]
MSTFEWSTPTRRSSTGPLNPLPLEVYQEILSHFQENDDMTAPEVRRHLCNMALVCRYFSSIALPRIFAELNIPNGCGDTSINRFCRALANNKEPAASLARYIKTCNFAASMPCEGSLRTQEAFFFISRNR